MCDFVFIPFAVPCRAASESVRNGRVFRDTRVHRFRHELIGAGKWEDDCIFGIINV